jgi:hypothetical protein
MRVATGPSVELDPSGVDLSGHVNTFRLDRVEAPTGILDRRAGHRTQKLIASDPDDRVIRT